MEPTLEQIDDFQDQESLEKKIGIRNVAIICLSAALVMVTAASIFDFVPDYIGR